MKTEYKIIKEEHYWTADEKVKWLGYGEWVEEVDLVHLEYLEYEVLVIRLMKREIYCPQEAWFGGHLCGYVKIPRSHHFFRHKDMANDIDCHGGVTFNEAHEEHWFGFDCAHSGDYVPTIEHFKKTDSQARAIENALRFPKGMEDHPWFKPVYRNMDYCIKECMGMITQLIDVSVNPTLKKGLEKMEMELTDEDKQI